jgi:uncharacterized protein with FMN-binding domain
LFVSSFVVFSFVAYVVRDHFINEEPISNEQTSSTVNTQTQAKVVLHQTAPTSEFLKPTLVPTQVPTQQPPVQDLLQQQSTQVPTQQPPTQVPTQQQPTATATDKPQGQYRDGTYVGPTTNAFYGLVQVQATIQGGQLTDVQFLQYPNDRRTSQRINSIAMPRLTQESIQVQSAYVHIVSGATLTSQAFAQSLYVVLNQAAT